MALFCLVGRMLLWARRESRPPGEQEDRARMRVVKAVMVGLAAFGSSTAKPFQAQRAPLRVLRS